MAREVYLTSAKYPVPDERTQTEWIYSLSEARNAGISWAENWKEAQEGCWLQTTDGFVLKCLKRAKAGWTEYIRTCIGTFSLRGDVCDTKPRQNRFTFSGRVHWSPDVSKAKCSVPEQKFANLVATKLYSGASDDMVEASREAFQAVWPNTVTNCKTTWKRFAQNLLQRPHIKREIKKYMGNPAADVNDKWLADEAKNAYEKISKEDGLSRLRGLNEIMKLRKNLGGEVASLRPDELDPADVARIEQERQEKLREGEEPAGGEDRTDDVVDVDDNELD